MGRQVYFRIKPLGLFKKISVVSCTEKYKKIDMDAINLANEEGLQAHAAQ